MVYLSDKGSGSGDMRMRRCTSESESQLKKTCVDCGTSKTPLWRSGPAGPKTLCNACGIKSRKKRRPSGSISKENKKPKNEDAANTVSSKSIEKDECKSSDKDECKSSDKEECKSSEKEEADKNDMHNMVKRIKMVLNGDAPIGTSNDEADSSGSDFGEEERAAILLMALSYGILSS